MAHLVLYDGVCGLCDRFVQFLLRIDRHDRLRFAALQGPIGTRILEQAGRTRSALSTVIVVVDYEQATQRLLDRSDAGLFAIASTGGLYRAAGGLRLVPHFIRDAVYNFIARRRYQMFGRFEACPIPRPSTRAKFLDFARPAPGP
ncbi:MAG: DCC1-like thiol-disulfide oxidoreductase family protein [Vicinamibacteria bacterium]